MRRPSNTTPFVARCLSHCLVYRLHDLYAGRMQKDLNIHNNNLSSVVCARWPQSVGCLYLSRTRKWRNKRALLDALDAYLLQRNSTRPSADALVVHLRLGDVLDWPFYKEVRKCDAEHGCYWVHPLRLYEQLRVPSSVRHVELVGDPWYRFDTHIGNRQSLAYRQRVADIFAHAHKLPVTIRPPAAADEDLAYMAQARHLVPSRGGFGALVADAAWHRNGSVFVRLRGTSVPAGIQSDAVAGAGAAVPVVGEFQRRPSRP